MITILNTCVLSNLMPDRWHRQAFSSDHLASGATAQNESCLKCHHLSTFDLKIQSFLHPCKWRLHSECVENSSPCSHNVGYNSGMHVFFSSVLITFHSHDWFYAPLIFAAYLSDLRDYESAHMKLRPIRNTIATFLSSPWPSPIIPVSHHSSVLHTLWSKRYRADQTHLLFLVFSF